MLQYWQSMTFKFIPFHSHTDVVSHLCVCYNASTFKGSTSFAHSLTDLLTHSTTNSLANSLTPLFDFYWYCVSPVCVLEF